MSSSGTTDISNETTAPTGFANIRLSVTDQGAIDRAERLLAGVEGGMAKALRSAMSKATARLRRANVSAVRERYAISAANIRAEENVQVSYRYGDGVQAYVRFSGKRIPLFRFDGASPHQPTRDTSTRMPVPFGEDNWRLAYPSVPASGHALKGTSPYKFDKAFVATMDSGHTGIFERTGGSTRYGGDEIKELYGPAVPQMLGNEAVEKKIGEEAMQSFGKDLDHEVLAILSGYMR